MLKKIAEGDWSDETQKAVDAAVSGYAEDFGFDLDEEGHPLEEGSDDERSRPGPQRGPRRRGGGGSGQGRLSPDA